MVMTKDEIKQFVRSKPRWFQELMHANMTDWKRMTCDDGLDYE